VAVRQRHAVGRAPRHDFMRAGRVERDGIAEIESVSSIFLRRFGIGVTDERPIDTNIEADRRIGEGRVSRAA
jgi:hypothetical protein